MSVLRQLALLLAPPAAVATTAHPGVLRRISPRARRVGISVRADGQVVLTLPVRHSVRAAEQFLAQSQPWIERTRARLAARKAAAPLDWSGPADRRALKSLALARARELLEAEGARLGLRHTGLTVRDTRSRWGSCAPDGRIMLALRLAMAPPEVFRYVVIHELCHLRWRGHGPRFWALVAKQMPDYQAHRRWLRQHGDALQAVALA